MRRRRPLSPLAVALAFAVAVACAPRATSPPRVVGAETAPGERRVTILAINDVYRIEGAEAGTDGGLARVRHLRRQLEREDPELLVLHAGDMLYPSLASRLYDGAQMIAILDLLDGAPRGFDERLFATFGNHEFDKASLAAAATVESRVRESDFTWLDTNIVWAEDEGGRPRVTAPNLEPWRIVDAGGLRVGLFSLTTDLQPAAYIAAFRDPVAVAAETTAALRAAGAELVVALTHLVIDRDVALLRALGEHGPDLVIGGHEHNRLCRRVAPTGAVDVCPPESIAGAGASLADGRLVVKADAEARTAAVVRVTVPPAGPARVAVEYRRLDRTAPEDPKVRAAVDRWLARHAAEFCGARDEPPTCLDRVLGRTRVQLVGEELAIRRYETNLGNWIADRALDAYRAEGADLALVNAGSLRLNQDLPPGEVTLRHVEEIFQFPSGLRLVELRGEDLQRVIEHAVTDWTGNGRWLQVAGVAFRHDPATTGADRLTLLGPAGRRPISPDETLRVVVPDFLVEPATGQDGYTMLSPEMVIAEAPAHDLRGLVIAGLEAAGEEGIAPEVEGRICNTEVTGRCLAIDPASAD